MEDFGTNIKNIKEAVDRLALYLDASDKAESEALTDVYASLDALQACMNDTAIHTSVGDLCAIAMPDRYYPGVRIAYTPADSDRRIDLVLAEVSNRSEVLDVHRNRILVDSAFEALEPLCSINGIKLQSRIRKAPHR